MEIQGWWCTIKSVCQPKSQPCHINCPKWHIYCSHSDKCFPSEIFEAECIVDKTNETNENKPKTPEASENYQTLTIALSVVAGFVLLIALVAGITYQSRTNNSSKVNSKNDEVSMERLDDNEKSTDASKYAMYAEQPNYYYAKDGKA